MLSLTNLPKELISEIMLRLQTRYLATICRTSKIFLELLRIDDFDNRHFEYWERIGDRGIKHNEYCKGRGAELLKYLHRNTHIGPLRWRFGYRSKVNGKIIPYDWDDGPECYDDSAKFEYADYYVPVIYYNPADLTDEDEY